MMDHLTRRPALWVFYVKLEPIKCRNLLFKRLGCRLIRGNALGKIHFAVTQSIMLDMSGAKPFHCTNGSGHQ